MDAPEPKLASDKAIREAVLRRYSDLLGWFIVRTGNRDTAADLAQDTILAFLKTGGETKAGRPIKHPVSFLFGIARKRLWQYFDEKRLLAGKERLRRGKTGEAQEQIIAEEDLEAEIVADLVSREECSTSATEPSGTAELSGKLTFPPETRQETHDAAEDGEENTDVAGPPDRRRRGKAQARRPQPEHDMFVARLLGMVAAEAVNRWVVAEGLGSTTREIAKERGCSIGAARVHLHDRRNKLRKKYAKLIKELKTV